MRTQGRPRSMREKKPIFISRASASNTPVTTSIPACCNRLTPSPATKGLESKVAITTRLIPAPINASAQGGVRP